MSETRKVKLSLDKFTSLLERHGYILVAVYCEGKYVRFAECRTPRQQKTFVVYLPEKYQMTVPTNVESNDLKRLDVSSIEAPPSSRQIEFISDMKGPLLECDLVAISSESVCMYRNNNSAECFNIDDGEADEGDEDDLEDAEGEIAESDDEVTALEKDTLNVLKKVKGPQAKLPKASLREPRPKTPETEPEDAEGEAEGSDELVLESTPPGSPSKSADDQLIEDEGGIVEIEDEDEPPEEELDAEGEDEVELVFEDEDGEPVDEVKTLLDTVAAEEAEESLRSIQAKVDRRDAETFGESDIEEEDEVDDIEESHNADNSLPPDLEEGELVLGIVYVMIDIGGFFRRIAVYEEEVIRCYEQLDENELEMRSKRLEKIRDVTQKFLLHSEERLNKIAAEEKDLKMQLVRLTVVLAQASALKTRVTEKPEKYGEIVGESDRIYDQTRAAIHELNMELLKLRDGADELLSNYRASIEDLLDM